MEDFYINITSQDKNFDYSNITNNYDDYGNLLHIQFVLRCIIISISLPLILGAIYAFYSLVRNDHVAPIYIINLLISDVIQICCMIVWVAQDNDWKSFMYANFIYDFSLTASVCFMVCVALERYLVIVHPLWYRFRRTIKISVVVCVVVWAVPTVFFVTVFFWADPEVAETIIGVCLLLPLPLFIFFLGGTLKALSTCTSVPSDEKQRIVAILVLVLLIYTLLFLPRAILSLSSRVRDNLTFISLSLILVQSSPLADLVMYVFMRKGTVDKLLASVCCRRMESNSISSSSTV